MITIQARVDHEMYLPQRAHRTDAGADLVSSENVVIAPGEKKMIDTGVAVKIPEGFVGLVFSRSSQGKKGIKLANAVGVIDSDYRGNIKVLLENHSNEPYEIEYGGTKVAQLVVVPIILPEFVSADSDSWDDTARSTGGFGSTGA